MKIKLERVKEIIKESVEEVLGEGASLCHNDEGHFSDCDSGSTYSISKSGAKSAGIDKKYVGRGKVAKKGKREDGSYSLSSKMGLNTSKTKQGGRIKFPDGKDISPKRSVSEYPKEYYEEGQDEEAKTKWDPDWKSAKKRKADHKILKPSHTSWFPGKEEMSQTARGVGLGIFEGMDGISRQDLLAVIEDAFRDDNLEEARGGMVEKCRAAGLISMSEAQKRILLSLNSFAKAQEGKLGEKD